MKDYTTQWTKDELKAYLLIYCTNADFNENKKEMSFIKKQTNIKSFDKIQREFDSESDFESIQKIQWTLAHYNYSEQDVDKLLEDIQALFTSDDDYNLLEKNLFLELKRLLKS